MKVNKRLEDGDKQDGYRKRNRKGNTFSIRTPKRKRHYLPKKKTDQQNSLRVMRRGEPFEKWGMDFVGPLPPTFWAAHLVREITLNHGLPKEITTDNGREFDGNLFGKYLKNLKIQHNRISPYHPQSNGLVERFHGTLLKNLRKLCLRNVNEWDRHLDEALFGYRTARNDFMGTSPFFMTYGVDPAVSTTAQQYQPSKDYSDRTRNITEFNQARQKAIENLHKNVEKRVGKE